MVHHSFSSQKVQYACISSMAMVLVTKATKAKFWLGFIFHPSLFFYSNETHTDKSLGVSDLIKTLADTYVGNPQNTNKRIFFAKSVGYPPPFHSLFWFSETELHNYNTTGCSSRAQRIKNAGDCETLFFPCYNVACSDSLSLLLVFLVSILS